MFQGQNSAVILDEEKPISPPGDVALDGIAAGDLDRNAAGVTVAGDVVDRGAVVAVIVETDDADGSFQAMMAGLDLVEMGERFSDADRAVPTHAECADIVEKDDARHTRGVGRLAEE